MALEQVLCCRTSGDRTLTGSDALVSHSRTCLMSRCRVAAGRQCVHAKWNLLQYCSIAFILQSTRNSTCSMVVLQMKHFARLVVLHSHSLMPGAFHGSSSSDSASDLSFPVSIVTVDQPPAAIIISIVGVGVRRLRIMVALAELLVTTCRLLACNIFFTFQSMC